MATTVLRMRGARARRVAGSWVLSEQINNHYSKAVVWNRYFIQTHGVLTCWAVTPFIGNCERRLYKFNFIKGIPTCPCSPPPIGLITFFLIEYNLTLQNLANVFSIGMLWCGLMHIHILFPLPEAANVNHFSKMNFIWEVGQSSQRLRSDFS